MGLESAYYTYMGFDARHAQRVRSHYVGFFRDAGPVVELGCGRGEFLDLLRDAGVEAFGVDEDEGMAAAARERGHRVVLGDALAELTGTEPGSLGGVFCAHLVEHLAPADASRLIGAASRALRPGGVFVAVTPNAACYAVLTRDFWRDPTHVRFYDPSLIEFLCDTNGLRVEESATNPLDHPGPPPGSEAELTLDLHVDPVPDSDTGEAADLRRALRETQNALRDLERAHRTLVWTLYQPNEVYVVARRPA